MKKLVLLLSFVFVLGLISVRAQDAPKKKIKNAPAKTEKVAPKPDDKAKPVTKAPEKGKKKTKKVVTPAK